MNGVDSTVVASILNNLHTLHRCIHIEGTFAREAHLSRIEVCVAWTSSGLDAGR